MIAEDQSQAIAFLDRGCEARRETHLSEIFLTADRALKLKRAVKLPYADFSTPALREAACRREVELNREAAPDLYLGVRRITRGPDDGLQFGGSGELVDTVVEMVRFDEDLLFDRLAKAGRLDPATIDAATDAIAAFHARARRIECDGAQAMAEVLDINRRGFAQSGFFAGGELADLDGRFMAALTTHATRLERRGRSGKVILGHGDLHLRNICIHAGRPLLFDRLEFNDAIATVDVLYDVAFLAMDLWRAGLPAHANRLVNRYVDRTGDEEGYRLLPFFMAVRAAIRAHVTATQWEEGGKSDEALGHVAREYFDLAAQMLEPGETRLVAIGGLSGSGKSTVAEALAWRIGAPPGARILESDRIRKAMHGVAPETRLGPEAYAPEVSDRVYGDMAQRARVHLDAGVAVVADAVFAAADDRAAIAAAARDAETSFAGVWLSAPPAELRRRVAARRQGASDADITVLEAQLDHVVEPKDWAWADATREARATASAIAGMAEA